MIELLDCAHCTASSTCNNGPSDTSCRVCSAAWRMRYSASIKRLFRSGSFKQDENIKV
jgi:hypothetical protein